MFHGQESDASCCGNQDPDEKVIVTYEVLNLTLTQAIIDELKGSTIDYTDGAGLDVNSSMYSSGTGYDLLTWNGGISVGDEVNIYMVYLNDNVNRRTDFGEVTFEDDIVAVGYDWRHTLWFTGSRFSLHTGNNKNNGDYPRYGKANSSSKFKDRWFEPSNEADGAPVIASWTTQGTSNDWFQVADVNGNDQAPGYAGGTAMKKFRLGCNNGLKGDFFRIITKAPACNGTSFNYSSAQYCVNFPFGNPSPNLTGVIDGTFSSSTGLIFADTNSNVGSSNGIIDLSASTPGNYTITYSYGVNCTLDFDVEILGLPTVDLGNDTAICQGNPITFEPSTTLANSFLWTYDSEEPDYSGWSSQTDDTITVTSNADVSFSSDYILTATNTCGSEDDTISVNVIPSDISFFLTSTSNPICAGQNTTLSLNLPADTYNWSPSATLNNATSSTPIASPIYTTTYTLNSVTSSCSQSGTITIVVDCLDSDNDSYEDNVDIDDDNDGISDADEGFECQTPSYNNSTDEWSGSLALTWSSLFPSSSGSIQYNGVDPITATNSQGTVGTFNIGETNVTLTRSTSGSYSIGSGSQRAYYRINNNQSPFNSSADQIVYNMWQASTNTGMSVHKFTFSNPVFNLAFKINDVDYESGAYKDNVAIRLLKSDGTYHTLSASEYNTTGQTVIISNDTTYFQGTDVGNQFNNEEVNITGVQAFISEMTIIYTNAEPGANSRQVISLSPIIFCESRDTDNDGVPDHLDLDADNDGIYDVFEAGLNANDSDNNGRINSNDTGFADANNNGMDDASESNMPTDTDSDFIFDYLELDSDDDGCFDVVEAGFTDGDSDGFLGTSPVTVGIDGTVTSGSDGYDSPNTNTSFQFYNTNFTSTTDSTVCESITWNGTTYTTSGSYQWTSQGGTGCDSVATLNLTVLADSVILTALIVQFVVEKLLP